MHTKELRLAELVEYEVSNFLKKHSDEVQPANVYKTVINEVDCAIFNAVLKYTANNQTKAAKMLGINRNTLRKKLEKTQYKL